MMALPNSSFAQAKTTMLTASISCSNSDKFNTCPSDMLCKLATKVNIKGSWPLKTKVTVWETNDAAVAAKRRGLGCNAKNKTVSVNEPLITSIKREFLDLSYVRKREIQLALSITGGWAHGKWTASTRKAINSFILQNNLKINVSKKEDILKLFKLINSIKDGSKNRLAIEQKNKKKCEDNPKLCDDSFLCTKATKSRIIRRDGKLVEEGSYLWDLSAAYLKFYNEAKSRGLTCGVNNRGLLSASLSNSSNNTNMASTSKLCSSDPKVCNSHYLCTYGTKLTNSKRVWETSSNFAKHAKEAKSRGLTCGVSTVSSSTSSSSVNNYQSSSSATSSSTNSNYTSSDQNIKQTFTSLNSNDRKTIQSFLKKKGYYSGIIDGQYGINTLRSLRIFLKTAPTKNIKTELNRVISNVTASKTVKKYKPIPKTNNVNAKSKQNSQNLSNFGFCVAKGTSPNALTNVAKCAHLLAGGGQTADWDFLPGSGQWRCRSISSGQFVASSRCDGYVPTDNRWPTND